MRKGKRILSWLLAVALAVTGVNFGMPAAVEAAEASADEWTGTLSGTGTQADGEVTLVAGAGVKKIDDGNHPEGSETFASYVAWDTARGCSELSEASIGCLQFEVPESLASDDIAAAKITLHVKEAVNAPQNVSYTTIALYRTDNLASVNPLDPKTYLAKDNDYSRENAIWGDKKYTNCSGDSTVGAVKSGEVTFDVTAMLKEACDGSGKLVLRAMTPTAGVYVYDERSAEYAPKISITSRQYAIDVAGAGTQADGNTTLVAGSGRKDLSGGETFAYYQAWDTARGCDELAEASVGCIQFDLPEDLSSDDIETAKIVLHVKETINAPTENSFTTIALYRTDNPTEAEPLNPKTYLAKNNDYNRENAVWGNKKFTSFTGNSKVGAIQNGEVDFDVTNLLKEACNGTGKLVFRAMTPMAGVYIYDQRSAEYAPRIEIAGMSRTGTTAIVKFLCGDQELKPSKTIKNVKIGSSYVLGEDEDTIVKDGSTYKKTENQNLAYHVVDGNCEVVVNYQAAQITGPADSGTSENPIAVTTRVGISPKLPEKVLAVFDDNSQKDLPVDWSNAVKPEDLAEATTTPKVIKGVFAGTDIGVFASLTVKEKDAFLLAKYAFEEGAEMKDSAGSKADATVDGNVATGVEGLIGTAIALPGGGHGKGAVKLPDDLLQANGQTQDDFTISLFMKRGDIGNSFVFSLLGEGNTKYFGLINHNNRFDMEYQHNGGNNRDTLSGTANRKAKVGEWAHVAIVTKGSSGEAKLYENGKEVAGIKINGKASALASQDNWIGRSRYSGDSDYKGTIDEFAVYGAALEPSEIKEINDVTFQTAIRNKLDALKLTYTDGKAVGQENGNLVIDIENPVLDFSNSEVEWGVDGACIMQDGTVNRPLKNAQDAQVKLTAKISLGGFSETREFNVTVKKLEGTSFKALDDAIAKAKALLEQVKKENCYTDASVGTFSTAIAAAEESRQKEELTDEEVQKAAGDLAAAVDRSRLSLKNFEEINKSLAVWYPMTGNAKDASGNNRDGVVNQGNEGSITFTRDNGMHLPGDSKRTNYISIPADNFPITNQMTFSFWAKDERGEKSNTFGLGGGKTNISGKPHFSMYTGEGETDNRGRAEFGPSGWTGQIPAYGGIGDVTFPKNEWHMLTCVVNGDAFTCYVDGVKGDTKTTTILLTEIWDRVPNERYLYIGNNIYAHNGNGDTDYKGYIKDFRIYNASLTDNQVGDIYDYMMKTLPMEYAKSDVIQALGATKDEDGNYTLNVTKADRLNLVKTGSQGETVAWESSNTSVIDADGNVANLTSDKKTVTLTATIALGEQSEEIRITCTVGIPVVIDEGVKNALEEALAKAAEYDGKENEYTPVTWGAYQAALVTAKARKDFPISNEATTEATEKLNEAMGGLVKRADMTALKALITQITSLTESDYTTASWEALEQPLSNARTIAENMNATQEDVDAAKEVLQTVKDALVRRGDKTELEALVRAVNGLAEANYTKASWAALQAALSETDGVMKAVDAVQEEVDNAKAKLSKAKEDLVSLEALKKAIADKEAYLEGKKQADYTKDSWDALQALLDSANALLAAEEVITQQDILDAAAGLADAELASRAVSKEALGELLDSLKDLVEENYGPALWAEFDAVRTAAQAAYDKEIPDWDEIEKALADLQAAHKKLMENTDKSALQAAIATAEELAAQECISDQYSPAAWKAFGDALKEAQRVDSELLSQREINAAAKALTDAQAALADSALESLEVGEGAKTQYRYGEQITAENFTVNAVYMDGVKADISDKLDFSKCGYNPLTPGMQALTFTFGGKTVKVEVRVATAPKSIYAYKAIRSVSFNSGDEWLMGDYEYADGPFRGKGLRVAGNPLDGWYIPKGTAFEDTDEERTATVMPDIAGSSFGTPRHSIVTFEMPKISKEAVGSIQSVQLELSVQAIKQIAQGARLGIYGNSLKEAWGKDGKRSVFGSDGNASGLSALELLGLTTEIEKGTTATTPVMADGQKIVLKSQKLRDYVKGLLLDDAYAKGEISFRIVASEFGGVYLSSEYAEEAFQPALFISYVNKDKLGEAIEGAVPAGQEELYTAESWAAYAEALEGAKAVFGSEDAAQEDVDAALASLLEAKAGLQEKPTDKRALQAAISNAEKLTAAEQYPQALWAAFQDALDAAKEVNGKAAKQEEIDKAASDLTEAQKTLEGAALAGLEAGEGFKTAYLYGESLAALKVFALYGDGSKEDVTAKAEVSAYDPIKEGKQTLTMAYGGKTASLEVTVEEAAKSVYVSANDWVTYRLPKTEKRVVIEYDVTPGKAPIDGMVGYSSTEDKMNDWGTVPICVRLSQDNGKAVFDARNAESFARDADVAYEADGTYHVKIIVDLDSKSYDVDITPEGGEAVRIATGYKFRTGAPAIADVGSMVVRGGSGVAAGEFFIADHSIAALAAVDTKPLADAIAEAEGMGQGAYTNASWTIFQKAIADAKALLDKAGLAQEEADEALLALQAAKGALQKADKAELHAWITEAGQFKASDYTSATWSALDMALQAARSVSENENASEAEIEKAAADLQKAVSGLVSTKSLKDKIQEAKEIKKDQYTASSWKAVEDALTTAENLLAKGDATQEELDTAIRSLDAAISKLVENSLEELRKAAAEAKKLQKADYSAKSWSTLQEALGNADSVKEGSATEVIQAAMEKLQAAVKGLVRITGLRDAVADAKEVQAQQSQYVAENWAAFEETLSYAESALKDAQGGREVSQGEIRAASAYLREALGELYRKADLSDAATQADRLLKDKDKYTADSIERLERAVQAAKDVSASAASSKDDYVKAEKELQDAMGALKEKTDTSALAAAVAQAEAKRKDDYTATSWKAFQEALEKAKAVLTNASTQAEVAAAQNALETAMGGLAERAGAQEIGSLNTEIQDVDRLDSGSYTAGSWESLQAAKEKAKKAAQEGGKAEVAAAKEALQKAKEGLVDIASLQKLLEEAGRLGQDAYTQASWPAFGEALAVARTVAKESYTTQESVDAALQDLKAAMSELEKKADTRELSRLIKEMAGLTLADYTPESRDTFSRALETAQDAIAQEKPQADVNKAAADLRAARDGLVKAPQKAGLDERILEMEEFTAAIGSDGSKYVPETWKKLQDALENAKKVSASAPQTEIDAARQALEDAFAGLQVPGDKTALIRQVEAIQAINGARYEQKEWEELQALLAQAKSLQEAPYALQDEINAMTDALRNARNALKVAKYQVVFDAAGGAAVEASQVLFGQTISEPPVPSREGYAFVGWYAGDVPFDFSAPITADTTITAKWEEIVLPSLSGAAVQVAKAVYNGKARKPEVTVKLNGKTLTEGIDFTVSYTNNVKVGQGKATIRGIGGFAGSKTVGFIIRPARVKSVKLVGKKGRKAAVKFAKAVGAKGYQILYSTNKSFKNAKKKNLTKNSITLSGLKKNKTYYVKVRAYAKINGKTTYGAFSTKGKVKIKK